MSSSRTLRTHTYLTPFESRLRIASGEFRIVPCKVIELIGDDYVDGKTSSTTVFNPRVYIYINMCACVIRVCSRPVCRQRPIRKAGDTYNTAGPRKASGFRFILQAGINYRRVSAKRDCRRRQLLTVRKSSVRRRRAIRSDGTRQNVTYVPTFGKRRVRVV